MWGALCLIDRKLVPYLINNVIKKKSEICNKGCMMMSLHTQINHMYIFEVTIL